MSSQYVIYAPVVAIRACLGIIARLTKASGVVRSIPLLASPSPLDIRHFTFIMIRTFILSFKIVKVNKYYF